MAIELQKKLDEESNEDLTAPTFDFHSLWRSESALSAFDHDMKFALYKF